MADIFEITYHLIAAIASLSAIVLIIIISKSNAETVRSRIFLKFKKFKAAFYVLVSGFILHLFGSMIGLINHDKYHFIHEITEITLNLVFIIFLILLIVVFKKRSDPKKI